ncbi:TetR/AcrR family transcriptional regulator [Halobacillus massiliensis]|uniref:TetR/AcrR family transcriptional regulator n=1 Tax=Halobacillus massiliensis TaxID=1926286 RepID=UPI0009E3893D|nr:TetR/AcrR family transcriptional regulator [Halobacillus massiliensis]
MSDLNDLLHILEESGTKTTPKQALILQAAVEIFAEKGYASTSTSEIASRAGVAEGTIFRHYKTKKDLLISIVTPVMARFTLPVFASHFIKEVFEKSPENLEELLKTLIKNRYHFVKDNAPLLKIMLQEVAFHEELQVQLQTTFLQEVYPRFERVIEHYKQQGIIVDFPSSSIIRMVMTTVIGLMVTRFIVAPQLEWEDEIEIDRTVHFLLFGLSSQ